MQGIQTIFINKRINYDGSQLRSHWIFEEAGVQGNAIASFIGACDISLGNMVDLVDKAAGCKICSEEMLHFIIESFGTNLKEMILKQRLFVSIMGEVLRSMKKNIPIERKGNDLYDANAKLNISIATASPISSLIHVGINISSKRTPVKTKGLKDYNIKPKTFAKKVLKRYKAEIEGIQIARAKVRAVI